ncbi:MAG: hypothetical protein LBD75_00625 [Candidatus Peribacteria bacterium]|nr:hypothetical protein [Candidatus Peribacteria bacterium]
MTTVESFRDETLGDHLGKWTNIEEEQLPYSLTIEKIYTFFDETLKDVANPSETYRITSVEAPTVSLTPVVITLANGETSTGVEIALPASENIRYLSGNQVITAITGTFGVGIYTGEIVVEKTVDCLTLTSALAERSITINEEVKNDNNSGGGSSSSG